MKTWLGAAFVIACKGPTPAVAAKTQVTPPPPDAPSPCANASHREADAAMRAAGLELCWSDPVVSDDGKPTGDSEAGFIALVHGNEVLSQNMLGGADAKGYGWTGEAHFLGARALTVRGHAILTIRWSQQTGGWSTGMGGSTDIRDVMTAVCTLGAAVKCPFIQETERELTVTGASARHDREAWTIDIAGDGVLTARLTHRFTDAEDQPPVRVPLF